MAGGNSPIDGDDSLANTDGARVEVNGGGSKAIARIERTQARNKTGRVEIDLGDSKDVRVELTYPRNKKGLVEIDLGESKDATDRKSVV